jgi:hypothetical protein
MQLETKNAIITGTQLGYEDHGILTAFLQLDYGNSGQGFGGYQLDTYSKENEGRTASIGCGFFIQRVLEVVGVDRWEQLNGKHIRVISDWNKVQGIGHILKDEWFFPEKEFKKLFQLDEEKGVA